MTESLPYAEGDWFAVPLRPNGYALGVAARFDGKGNMLAYFFGSRQSEWPAIHQAETLESSIAILIAICRDTGVRNGRWPKLGRLPSWERSFWPLPEFLTASTITNELYRVLYSEVDLEEEVSVRPCSDDDARRLYEGDVFGVTAIELRLSKLLS